MAQIEFSLLSSSEPVLAAVREFEAQSGIRVQVNTLNWDTAWAELVRMAVVGAGPDLSEVGSTWAESLMAMNALRPFSPQEIAALGSADAYLPALWRAASSGGQFWGIPWLADTRILYYRRDWLAQAGIDEATAFQTAEQLQQTLQTLKENGVTIPWALPTTRTPSVLHNLAPWVWGAGGHFMSSDGKQTRFSEPAALDGIEAYYRLFPYLPADAPLMNETVAHTLLRQGQAAATISGRWTLAFMGQSNTVPEVQANLGMAQVPGVPFVGGSALVIWKNSRRSREALELARYLTGFEVQSGPILLQGPFLPARTDVLANPTFNENPFHRQFGQSLQNGRGFLATYMWGLVEDKLTLALSRLWADLAANPGADVRELISGRLVPLAERLDQTLTERSHTGNS